MVSVTPDITASTSFQAPPPRVKADPAPGNDSFAALVDSNTAAAAANSDRNQDRTQDRTQDKAQDRTQDTAAAPQQTTPEKRSAPARRDAAADSKDQPGLSERADHDVTAADQAGDDTPADAQTDKRTETKSTADETGETKQAEKPSCDVTEATNSTDVQVTADAATAETVNAVATALFAIVAPEVQASSAPSPIPTTAGGSAGPLTIAVAAIAASKAVTEAAVVPATVATATEAETNAAAKTRTGANAGEAIAAPAESTPSEGEAAAPAVALTVPPAQPATPKAASAAKVSTTPRDTAASPDQVAGAAITTDAPASDTSTAAATSGTEPTATTQPHAGNAHAAQAKPEPTDPRAPSAVAGHLNPAGHEAATAPSNTQASTTQAAASIQPLIQTTATQVQPSFTVTAAAPSAAVPASGVALEIAASVRSGKSRFEIRLDPAELGRIDVRIDVDRNGQVISHLTVEKPETLSMLRQDAPQLQRALTDAGLSTGDSGLQFSLRDQSSSGQNGDQSNPNARRLILTEEDPSPGAIAGTYGRLLGNSGGVDIRV